MIQKPGLTHQCVSDWLFFTLVVCNKDNKSRGINVLFEIVFCVFLYQVKMKYSMDGNFNGQSFTVVGEGTGNPYE